MSVSISNLLGHETRLSLLYLLHRIITQSSGLDDGAINVVWRAGSCLAIETFSVLISGLLMDLSEKSLSIDNENLFVGIISRWLKVISLATHEDQPVDMRLSGARGLALSRLLELHTTPLTTDKSDFSASNTSCRTREWVLDILLLIQDLLQDDDDEVREEVNALVCNVVAISNTRCSVVATPVSYLSIANANNFSLIHRNQSQSYSLEFYLPEYISKVLLHTTMDSEVEVSNKLMLKTVHKLFDVIGSAEAVQSLLQKTNKELSHKV
jgi:hypothetical protein